MSQAICHSVRDKPAPYLIRINPSPFSILHSPFSLLPAAGETPIVTSVTFFVPHVCPPFFEEALDRPVRLQRSAVVC